MRAHIGVEWFGDSLEPVGIAASEVLARLHGVSEVRIEKERAGMAMLSYRWNVAGVRLPRVEVALKAAGIRML